MSDSLHDDLNPPQREAVLYGNGALLVLAGAGSGKTRVITRRIAQLVTHREVPAWRILAVTFTNKAAREMRERLQLLLGPVASNLTVATFHSAAAMILRREIEHVPSMVNEPDVDALRLTRSFVICDDADQLQTVKRAVKDLKIDSGVMTPRDYLSRIDQHKNAAKLPHQVTVDEGDLRGQYALKVYHRYQRLLRAANAVDFGDLLLLVVDLFRSRAEVREKYRRRFEHVLVDEFQDTNPVQYHFLKLIAPPGSNLVVVGDDDQSIYRWRGAEVENILRFPEDYPGTRQVKLEQNYRSDQNILEAANAVISHNPRRMPKRLWSDRAQGDKLQLIASRDERGEAQEIARQIHALADEGFIGYSQMAVLYRANAQSRVLEEAFRLAQVPYTLVSGRSFYERAEVRDAASYLRLMVNLRSEGDLLRVINVPAKGIGDTTVERLIEFARRADLSLFESLALAEQITTLNKAAVRRLVGVYTLLKSLHAFAEQSHDAASTVEKMLNVTGLIATLEAEGTDEAFSRAENLREFLGAAQEFDLSQSLAGPLSPQSLAIDVPPLQAFLEQISLVADADAEVSQGRVALMTLHAAKGLEFEAVFVAGMEEDVFPHSRASREDATEEDMAEERRLCYVAFTRARKRLYVSLAQSRSLFGELKFNSPSRFLKEVPADLVEGGLLATPEPPPPRFRSSWRDEPVRRSVPDRDFDQSSSIDSVQGTKVKHIQFGEGRIIDCDGEGPNAKVTVKFPSVGLKRVVARFLTPS